MAPSTKLNIGGIAAAAGGLLVVFFLAKAIYNLYFHPLRKFPGPFLNRATRGAHVFYLLRGTLPKDVLRMHDKYGPVVRIAPNELAFIDPEAWRDIYGHRTGANHGVEEMPKAQHFYRTRGIPPSMINESRDNHAMLRKAMAHGFSERSIRDQEPIVTRYVKLLVQRLGEHCEEDVYTDEKKEKTQTRPKPIDMKLAYNWTTFDIIGDLAFGEAFGCLEKWEYHPWVNIIANTIKGGAFVQATKHMNLERLVAPLMRLGLSRRKEHMNRTKEMLERRMAIDVERPDLIEGLLKHKDDWGIDFGRLRTNASLIVVAGSETTATLLSGVTFLLLSNPDKMAKLVDEVRSSFKSDDEITLLSVGNLHYMLACLNEALRCYPPVPIGMPRQVPKAGAQIAGNAVPADTVVSVWQYASNHSSRNWEDPFEYKPERFIGENNHDKLDSTQPFSLGPRNCIGRNLAIAEMRLILAKVLFNFDMKLVNPKENWADQKVYTLWDKRPLNVYLTPVRP